MNLRFYQISLILSTQGKLEISMIVGDYEGSAFPVTNLDTIIMRVTATKKTTYSSEMKFSGVRLSTPSIAAIKYRLICNTNYYGNYCTVYCLAENDMNASYWCDSQTGKKICKAGFSGSNCRFFF